MTRLEETATVDLRRSDEATAIYWQRCDKTDEGARGLTGLNVWLKPLGEGARATVTFRLQPNKLLRSRDRWRKLALLCMTLLAAGCVMFIVQCAKLP
jgi:hypothetical protein